MRYFNSNDIEKIWIRDKSRDENGTYEHAYIEKKEGNPIYLEDKEAELEIVEIISEKET